MVDGRRLEFGIEIIGPLPVSRLDHFLPILKIPRESEPEEAGPRSAVSPRRICYKTAFIVICRNRPFRMSQ